MTEYSTNLPTPQSVLVIPAHPDDAEFGAGGSIAKWAAEGARVEYLVVTDGSKGTWNPEARPAQLAARREEEQARACHTLGSRPPNFLGLRDGMVEASIDLRREISGWIRRLRTDIVVTHDPWRRYMLHPDHRAVGISVIDAVVAARDPHFFPEQLGPDTPAHRPNHLLLWAADLEDHVEELGEREIELKLLALRAHETQFESTMGHRGPDTQEGRDFDGRIRQKCRTAGGLAGYAYGEAFKIIDPAR